MSQFRTVADLADEVLTKAGEPTNGNSPFESRAITYLNKAHQAIVGGGNILSLQVDEPWVWARSRFPIVLELQPAVTTGTLTVTQDSKSVTFSSAPTPSLEGWFIQLIGKKSVYKLTQHTAANTAGTLDSGVMEDSGIYSFRAFKLDYDIAPTYLTVDSRNDKIDFVEVGTTQLTATLTHGSYTPAALVTHVVAQLHAAGTAALYSGSYDTVLKLFTFTSSLAGGKIFTLLGATGTNRRRSALPLLGYNQLDFTVSNATGTGYYTSTYIINGVSRLIEPFKVFTKANADPYVRSSDTFNMEFDNPIAWVREGVPTEFAKLTEDNEGSIVVRFNRYPAEKTKVTIDWIPIPIDLQDNAASYPLVPRKDIDTLIHAAAAFLLYDKHSNKFETTFQMATAGLAAMQKKNRSELFRTSQEFGQIAPRQDQIAKPRRLSYGYDSGER